MNPGAYFHLLFGLCALENFGGVAKPCGLGKLALHPLGRDGSNPKWGRDLADHDGRTDQTPVYRPAGKRTKGLASAFGAANPQEDENPGVYVKNVVQLFALCEPITVDPCKITAEVGLGIVANSILALRSGGLP